MQGAPHVFGQTPTLEGVRQFGQVAGSPQNPALLAAPWSHLPSLPVERVKRTCGVALRWSARSVYLSPLLILLRLGPRSVGDAGVVIVVAIGVVFFSLLNAFVALSLFAYRARKRSPQTPTFRIPFSDRGEDQLGLMRGGKEPSAAVAAEQLIRVQGTVRGLHGVQRGSVVMRDLWWLEQGARLTELFDFLVERGDEPPVLLRFQAAPMLLATPDAASSHDLRVDPQALRFLPFSTLPASACRRVQLHDGDEVELTAVVEKVVENVMTLGVLPETDGPYRGQASRPGIVVRSAFQRPACLRVLRAGFS